MIREPPGSQSSLGHGKESGELHAHRRTAVVKYRAQLLFEDAGTEQRSVVAFDLGPRWFLDDRSRRESSKARKPRCLLRDAAVLGQRIVPRQK